MILMLALGVNVFGNSPPFECSCSVPVFVRRLPPNTPRDSDTVATAGSRDSLFVSRVIGGQQNLAFAD